MSNFWGPFFHFFGVKKFLKYFSNRIEKLYKMAFPIFFLFFFEKVEKSWKTIFLGLKMPL